MRFLSNKEKKGLKGKLPLGCSFEKKDEITQKDNIIYRNKEPFLIVLDGSYLPHLKSVDDKEYKSVFVDRGAIPFVIKGADLMRPGIEKIDEGINVNDVVLVKDTQYEKLLGIGFAMFNSSDMKNQEKGKSVKIFHYFGDEFYNG